MAFSRVSFTSSSPYRVGTGLGVSKTNEQADFTLFLDNLKPLQLFLFGKTPMSAITRISN